MSAIGQDLKPRTIGEFLRASRLAAGMSQKVAEAHTGIDATRISSYENGRIDPSIATLELLCRPTRSRT